MRKELVWEKWKERGWTEEKKKNMEEIPSQCSRHEQTSCIVFLTCEASLTHAPCKLTGDSRSYQLRVWGGGREEREEREESRREGGWMRMKKKEETKMKRREKNDERESYQPQRVAQRSLSNLCGEAL